MVTYEVVPVDVQRTYAHCDCGGELIAQPWTYNSFPPSYPHLCTACNKQHYLHQCYPVLTYTDRQQSRTKMCPVCEGTKMFEDEPCPECDGSGVLL